MVDRKRTRRICGRDCRWQPNAALSWTPGYGGGMLERDGGYHQGPVWGWLLGPFCLAAYRVNGDRAAAQALLERMSDALEDQGLGTIGEIFEGDPPHNPCGAPAQAWSVACTLDAWRLLSQTQQTNQTGSAR
jgi:glycogen debranching enzyme